MDAALLGAACRLGLPYKAIADLAEIDPLELRYRQDSENHWPLGSGALAGFGSDPKAWEVLVYRQFNPHSLATAEGTEAIKSHPSFDRYCQRFHDGEVPPPIRVFEGDPGQPAVSANRRRVLAAQETNRPVPGWLVPMNESTGLSLKLGAVLAVIQEERGHLKSSNRFSASAPDARRHITETDLSEEELAQGRVAMPEFLLMRGRRRPTRNSEGRIIAATGDALRNFWEWFGDSHATDDEGRPRVFYHGTIVRPSRQDGRDLGDVTAFDRRATMTMVGRRPSFDAAGVWLSSTPQGAAKYAPGVGGAVYPIYTRARKSRDFASFEDFMADWKVGHDKNTTDPALWSAHCANPAFGDPDGYNGRKLREGVDALVIMPHSSAESLEFADQMAVIVLDERDLASACGSTWALEDTVRERSADIRKGRDRGRDAIWRPWCALLPFEAGAVASNSPRLSSCRPA